MLFLKLFFALRTHSTSSIQYRVHFSRMHFPFASPKASYAASGKRPGSVAHFSQTLWDYTRVPLVTLLGVIFKGWLVK